MAFNSTIQKKHCKCQPLCQKWPTMSCFGYFYAHMPEDLAKKAGTRQKVAKRNKNRNKSIMMKARKYEREVNGEGDQAIWYVLKKHEMTGVCIEGDCKNMTNKYNNEYFKWSIAHVVPKKLIPSVATHPENWLELCWQHHSEYDSNFEKASKMQCFAEAKRKFQLFKDLIPPEQLRKVNPHLLDTL